MKKIINAQSGLLRFVKKQESVTPIESSCKNTTRQLSKEEYTERLKKTSMSEKEINMVIQRLIDKGVYK